MIDQARNLEQRANKLREQSFYQLFESVVECSELLQQINPSRRRPWLASVIEEMFEVQDGLCGICNKPMNFGEHEVDHVIPVCYGGGNERGNLQLAHTKCNRMKRTEVDPHDLLRYLEDRYMNR